MHKIQEDNTGTTRLKMASLSCKEKLSSSEENPTQLSPVTILKITLTIPKQLKVNTKDKNHIKVHLQGHD
jgi:hypothetical protein